MIVISVVIWMIWKMRSHSRFYVLIAFTLVVFQLKELMFMVENKSKKHICNIVSYFFVQKFFIHYQKNVIQPPTKSVTKWVKLVANTSSHRTQIVVKTLVAKQLAIDFCLKMFLQIFNKNVNFNKNIIVIFNTKSKLSVNLRRVNISSFLQKVSTKLKLKTNIGQN